MQDIYVEMWVFSTASKTPSLYSNMKYEENES